MSLPDFLPSSVARRVRELSRQRGVPPEQVVISAVEAAVGTDRESQPDNPLAAAQRDLLQLALDGSLREDIDSVVDDADLAVG